MSENDTLDSPKNGSLSGVAIANAKATAPWMKFISIFMLVLLGLGAIGAIFSLIAMPAVGLIYLLVIGFMIYWNIQLLSMGSALSNFANAGGDNFLEQFFAKQKTFYLICGIILILYIVLFLIAIFTGASIFNAALQSPGGYGF